jgi:membrane-associated phospholipid phosphatase
VPWSESVYFWNAATRILRAIALGPPSAPLGSRWSPIERWAGSAGILVAGLLLLVVLAGLLAGWAIRHEMALRAHWAAFLAHPRVVALRARFAPQLAFLQARLSLEEYLGLHLTCGIVLIVLGSWMFGAIAEAIVHGDPLVQLDLAVSQFLHANARPAFTTAMLAVTFMGSYAIIVGSLLIGAILAWRHRWYELSMLVLAVAGGGLINLLLKALFARDRPAFPEPLVTAPGSSFPSGHAMAAMIFYGLMMYFGVRWLTAWRWRVLVVVAGTVLIALIGFSRIYLGVHYLSDVLGGYMAGLTWLAFTITGVETWRRGRSLRRQRGQVTETGFNP